MRFTLLALLALSTSAFAVPLELRHQGRLFDTAGDPLTGANTVSLILYDAPSGGAPLWMEDHVDMAFDQGYYSVTVGSVNALDSAMFTGDTLYLALRVNSGLELPQRLPLLSVPYAIRAGDADRADVATSVEGGAANVSELRVNGALIADSSGLTATPSAHAHDAADVTTGVLAPTRLPNHNHDAGEITSGTLAMTQLPIGTSADTVSRGDHGHDLSAMTGTLPASALPDGVVLHDPGDTCTSAELGTVRYVGDAFQGCTTAGWVELGAPSANSGASALQAGASCAALHADHPELGTASYWIDPDGLSSGAAPFQVVCDMVTEGGGWLDLVASFQATGDAQALLDRFFLTNGAGGTTISAGVGIEPATFTPGFYINNSAVGGHTAGFHLRSAAPYSQVRLAYRMQGAQNDSNRCASGNWIPLNGPGYNGGSTSYQSPCVSGYTCIQGSCTDGRDAPIQASYLNNAIDSSNTLLTWSGSVTSTVSDSCARDAQIPTDHPTTWFTTLRVR